MAVRICLLDSSSSPCRGMTKVTILPDWSDSGTTILNDLENITSPTSFREGILRVNSLKIEYSVSSPTLCRSSITINEGDSDKPAEIRFTAILV